MQAAMESVAYVQSVKDWNLRIMTANFDWALLDACIHLGPFWMHPDIWGKYRIEFQKPFASRGFRFNPLTMQDDRFGVFVEPLGSYFIVFQIESSDDMLSRTSVWKISGQIVGGVWEPSAKERLTVIGPSESSLSLRISNEELLLQCQQRTSATTTCFIIIKHTPL